MNQHMLRLMYHLFFFAGYAWVAGDACGEVGIMAGGAVPETKYHCGMPAARR